MVRASMLALRRVVVTAGGTTVLRNLFNSDHLMEALEGKRENKSGSYTTDPSLDVGTAKINSGYSKLE